MKRIFQFVFVFASSLLSGLQSGCVSGPSENDSAPKLGELKEGLWSVHTHFVMSASHHTLVESDSGTYSLCRNHESDTTSKRTNHASCRLTSDGWDRGAHSFEYVCTQGENTITIKGTDIIEGSSTHSTLHATISSVKGAFIDEITAVEDQVYLDACPGAVKPGNSIYKDGTIVQSAGFRPGTHGQPVVLLFNPFPDFLGLL